ncbi:olfactory receptor 14A16-like [Mauremys mutica]|uniref:olfactory receptor 14A16-like n=1 Tax=Mauremys mutica TaxID=74926 RepID=UPI001D160175|nr:olfactory receptor 14A16-like [Mauremys mutica]
MSVDCYVAICTPLRYSTITSPRISVQLVVVSWVAGFFSVLSRIIIIISQLPFCGPHIIDHFFCDTEPLIKLSWADTSLLELIEFSLSSVVLLSLLMLTVVSYLYIIATIFRIPSTTGRKKTSTCASHITVASIFYVSAIFMYVVPNKGFSFGLKKVVTLQTAFVTHLLNPFIYTPRNQMVKEVPRDTVSYFLSVIYLAALMENLLIFMAIAFDHHLHTPMYFFLMNLSLLDLGSISVIVPKSMANSVMDTRSISYAGCVAQVFFLVFLVGADFSLLTIMAYDRYVAICQPLHYERMMNIRACVKMAAGAWISGILYSVLHTGNTFALIFCGGNMVDQFFCEIPQLLKLACSDTYLSEVGVLVFNACLLLGCFVFIILSYVKIFKSVLRIPSEQGQHKALSICLPHLTVVSLFVCTGAFAYLKPTSSSPSALDLVVAILYSVLPPIMNPVIYSMRNKEMKTALRRLTGCR